MPADRRPTALVRQLSSLAILAQLPPVVESQTRKNLCAPQRPLWLTFFDGKLERESSFSWRVEVSNCMALLRELRGFSQRPLRFKIFKPLTTQSFAEGATQPIQYPFHKFRPTESSNPHAIILYSQSLRARRTVSINVLSAPTIVFGRVKSA